jgi:hypothetical protein
MARNEGGGNRKNYHISIFGLVCVRIFFYKETNKDLYFIFGL